MSYRMVVFVSSSRKHYDQVKAIKVRLDEISIRGFYPYFELDDTDVETNPEEKKRVTLQHFPEIDQVDVLCIRGILETEKTISLIRANGRITKLNYDHLPRL